MREYQVTLYCSNGKYKPISCVVTLSDHATKQGIQNKGIIKICQKRYWTKTDLRKYQYDRVKYRIYDKAKIEAENKTRYDAIKEAKYQSGEWKRPAEK